MSAYLSADISLGQLVVDGSVPYLFGDSLSFGESGPLPSSSARDEVVVHEHLSSARDEVVVHEHLSFGHLTLRWRKLISLLPLLWRMGMKVVGEEVLEKADRLHGVLEQKLRLAIRLLNWSHHTRSSWQAMRRMSVD
ncbi:hypothetical protein L2E82_38751 [Cichorium intybus]|uniref:Uncharacterized protein n=1 Tax=Cichorium intybus TaxID=13427 RepID=A0ACB9AGG1_CICIN|nr:hypothetical protein L2E82_38751 [Cichorium intybus]